MTFIAAALIGAGAAVVGGAIAGRGASRAASTQAASADRAAALQDEQYQQTREDQLPFLEGGRNALARQQQLLGLGADQGTGDFGRLSRDFGMGDFQADPGYAFRLSEGQKALERNSAARGGLISGSALRAATRFGQDMGSQEYQNAFNRFQTNRANQLNPLQSIAGQGQSVANSLGTAGQNFANQAGNAFMNAGNARASGYVGQGNALNDALGGAANSYMSGQIMNRMMPRQPSFTNSFGRSGGGMFSNALSPDVGF